MPGRARDPFKTDFKHQRGLNASNRPEPLDRRPTNDRVDLPYLGIGKTGVGLGKRYQLPRLAGRFVPDRKGVVGIEPSTPAMTSLCVDQHGIDCERV